MINLKIEQLNKSKKEEAIKIFNDLKSKFLKVMSILEVDKKNMMFNTKWKINIKNIDTQEVKMVMAHANQLKSHGTKNVVLIGKKKLIQAPKAMIESLKQFGDEAANFIYVNELSCHNFSQVKEKLEKLDNFLIVVVSSENNEVETHLNLWNAYKILKEKKGAERANEQTIVISKTHCDYLKTIANENNWKIASVNQVIADKFSLMSPIGLIPLALAGIDLKLFLQGVNQANRLFDNKAILQNSGIQYALIRSHFNSSNKSELLTAYNRQLYKVIHLIANILNDYQQHKKIIGTNSNCLVLAKLWANDDVLENHSNNFFETSITIKQPLCQENIDNPFSISCVEKLAEKANLFQISKAIEKSYIKHHSEKYGTKSMEIEIEQFDVQNIGYLYGWFINSFIINSLISKIDPFAESSGSNYINYFNQELQTIINLDLKDSDKDDIDKAVDEINEKVSVEPELKLESKMDQEEMKIEVKNDFMQPKNDFMEVKNDFIQVKKEENLINVDQPMDLEAEFESSLEDDATELDIEKTEEQEIE